MRKTQLADALFPKTRQGILAATVLNPERWWFLSDLARRLSTRPSSLQRELESLVEAGILLRREEGRQVYFKPNPECPILADLQSLMAKTVGLVDVLREALEPFRDRVACAFIYGSLARAELGVESDIDLMVLGAVKLSELAPAIQAVTGRLEREINPIVYTKREFAIKCKSGHHFVKTVLSAEKLFIIGSEDELQAASKSGQGTNPQDKQKGARRTSRRR